jgi:hypothetical protein
VELLVSDSSVLIDLERGELLFVALASPLTFVVPDQLYEAELHAQGGASWVAGGLRVVDLSGDEVEQGQSYLKRDGALSVSDAFALALAAGRRWTLLTGDARLRALAEADRVPVHGTLWLIEELRAHVDALTLATGLERMAAHPRARLPRLEVRQLLERLRIVS